MTAHSVARSWVSVNQGSLDDPSGLGVKYSMAVNDMRHVEA
jgi:hypothetical protein